MGLVEGRHWEARAARYLERHGLRIVLRGYRCRLGEIDLVCFEDDTLVVVEVRARGGSALVAAVFSIGERKRRRIVQATRHLLMHYPDWASLPIRFDVLAIDGIDTDSPKVDWIKSAFDAG